ncbi:hypothetical protein MTR67_038968 [Solanum verrucosum]|uniref:Uncharacterized protein n=1 Tax=Solanum verrucosum TaxID=315347 RepID=A0AAF0UHJ9_SOLVR|nr:hypothetical protein MTR67_038968 [Solanum verrucosum]
MSVLYHPGKASVVVDALSQLSMGSGSHVEEGKKELVSDVIGSLNQWSCNGSQSYFVSEVKTKKGLDPFLIELNELMLKKSFEAFSQGGDRVLRYQGHLFVPNVDDLREKILS